jgi:hypothetical protein
MKKIEKAGQVRNVAMKLKLSRETLRQLDASALGHVVAGSVVTCEDGLTCQATKLECETKNVGG